MLQVKELLQTMVENQDLRNVVQDVQIPEERAFERPNRDEFGELIGGDPRNPQDRQQNQESMNNIQEQGGNNNVIPPAVEPSPVQENQEANQGDQGGIRRDGGGRGNGGHGSGFRGRGGWGRGRGGQNNNRGGQYEVGGYGRYQQQQGVFNVGPYGGARGQQQNYNLGPSLFNMIPRDQNYVSENRNPQGSGRFQYPTDPVGPFARAMSQVTCNPTTANQGTVPEQKLFGRELFEQLQMALSVQLGFNGPQQVKERALHNVLTSATARVDMKQILQSRAELYGDELDTKLFRKNADLGGKANTLKERNQARAQLAGAPLLVAQISALELRRKLMEGDNNLLQNLRMGTWTTVAELLKVFGKISPLSLLYICNPEIGKYVTEHLLQHGDDLDFVQDVLTATGVSKELNPILNSVLAGFGRRKRYGRFKCGQLNLHFDRLRFAETATENDNDEKSKRSHSKSSGKAKGG